MAYQTPQEESFQEDAELATLFQEDAEFTPLPQEEVGLAMLLGFSPLQTYVYIASPFSPLVFCFQNI